MAPMGRPVRLVAVGEGTHVRLSVVGESATACEVSYELRVMNAPAGNANRSVQRGTARLLPNGKETLARVSMGATAEPWNATLIVTGCGGQRYQLSAGSAGSAITPRRLN